MNSFKGLTGALIIGLVVMLPRMSSAATYYVGTNGDDGAAGTSWIAAKKTIQAGVDAAGNGDTVLVTNGEFVLSGQITVSKTITVRSVNGPMATIVNGNGPITFNRCFYLGTACTLDGFTVTNGYVTNFLGDAFGAGVYCANADVIINNCTLSGNSASAGGGVYGGTLNNCTLSDNLAYDAGGGACNDTLNNCALSRNSAPSGGGVSFGQLNNCTLSGNSASTGGGANAGVLNNCLLAENSAGAGGGAFLGTLNNCTLSRNTASPGSGSYFSILNNCIVYHNIGTNNVSGGTILYTCAPDAPSGNGNILSDPLFVDKDGGNYRLTAYSPCINAGNNLYAPTNVSPFDLDGNPRVYLSNVDMGAYEYGSPVPTPPDAPTCVSASDGTFSDRVRVTWNTALGACSYEVWRNTADNSDQAIKQDFTSSINMFDDMTAIAGTNYYYWVKAKNATGTSGFSASDSGYRCSSSVINGIINADFDGDGKSDPCVYDASGGRWTVKLSTAGYATMVFDALLGAPGWKPAAADYDGDGLADPGIYNEANGKWIVLLSGANYYKLELPGLLGGPGQSPCPADYDGDLKAGPAVYNEATGDWQVMLSSAGYYTITLANSLGEAGCGPCPADFDGDKLADPAVYAEATGDWIVLLSSTGYFRLTLPGLLGGPGFLPVPADYDGDTKADPAVRKTDGSEWRVMLSGSGYYLISVPLGL